MAGDQGNIFAGEVRRGETAEGVLERLGVVRAADGTVTIPPEALKRLRDDRARALAVSAVPSTPRYLNRNAGGRGFEKPVAPSGATSLSLGALRTIRENSPILAPIHAAREHQIRRLTRRYSGRPGDVGFRVVHERYAEPDFDPGEGFQRYVRQFERVLFNPSPRYCPTLSQAMVQLEEDHLTINRPTIEVLPSAVDPGRIVGFRPVDGALVWPTLEWLEVWKGQNPRWFAHRTLTENDLTPDQQMDELSALIGYELHGAEFCLVREGILEAVYRPGALLVAPVVNRTDVNRVGYPPSTVETAIAAVLAFLNTWQYNDSFFTKGMMAEFALGISGNLHPSDMDAIADMFREATQGVGRAWQPPFIPLPETGALTKIDLKAPNKDMMYEVWSSMLIALTCASYRMDPSEINAKPWDGGGGPSLSERGRGDEIALAKEEGLQSDVEHIALNLLTPLAKRCHPDLMVVAEYGGDAPSLQAEVHSKRAAVHVTRNEIRLLDGLTPLGFWRPPKELEKLSPADLKKYEDNPWNWPTDPGFASAKQAAMQAEQQAEMMKQQQQAGGDGDDAPQGDDDDDGFGQPPGGDEDDGYGQPAPRRPFGKAVDYVLDVVTPRWRR